MIKVFNWEQMECDIREQTKDKNKYNINTIVAKNKKSSKEIKKYIKVPLEDKIKKK